eukprot:6927421-Prymnesium_polylepis.1
MYPHMRLGRARPPPLALLLLFSFFFFSVLLWQHQQLTEGHAPTPVRTTPERRIPQNRSSVRAPRPPSRQQHTQTLQRNGPALTAVDLVFLSEAYPADRAGQFFDDAARIVREHFHSAGGAFAVSYTHLRAHETLMNL